MSKLDDAFDKYGEFTEGYPGNTKAAVKHLFKTLVDKAYLDLDEEETDVGVLYDKLYELIEKL